jgi:hypothetical protein
VKSAEWFRMRAKELYHQEGEIEVDDKALVSRGDSTGAYVEAWVWIPSEERAESGNQGIS